jgi:hypothetical protein
MAGGRFELWTASQRRGLAVILSILFLILAVRLMLNRAIIPDPQPPRGSAADQLADRIDPNIASSAEIAEIPGVGEKRAAAIVDYRQQFIKLHPGRLAFARLADLEAVKGIGPATSEGMEPYLIFPGPSPRP